MSNIFNPVLKKHLDISILEDNIEEIRKEYLENIEEYENAINSLEDSITEIESYFENTKNLDVVFTKPIKTIRPQKNYAEGWTSTWIAYNNRFYDPVEQYFPTTYKVLKEYGNIFHATFNSLAPMGNIKRHIGVEKNSMMRSLWCFISPKEKDCFIAAEDTETSKIEKFYFEENSSFTFDDNKWYHWVENNTSEERVVLAFDYWTDKDAIKDFTKSIFYEMPSNGKDLPSLASFENQIIYDE